MLFESHQQTKVDNKRQGLTNTLEKLEQLVAKQENTEERKAIEASLESLNAYFQELQETETAMEKALTSVESGEVSEETQQKM